MSIIDRSRQRLTYANVMATVAAFMALGGTGALAATHLGRDSVGTGQLRRGAVTGAKVKDGSLSGVDIVASSLGQVPAAGHADTAASADRAATAATAATAQRAQRAQTADHAATADSSAVAAHADTATSAARADTAGDAAVAEALTPPEAVHFLDEPGEPRNVGSFKLLSGVGFWRDHEGIVHLQGHLEPTVDNAGGLTEELPVADRPEEVALFFGVTPKGTARVLVTLAGRIEILGAGKEEIVSLDGLTWRADERTQA